jgi:hypothetical protein
MPYIRSILECYTLIGWGYVVQPSVDTRRVLELGCFVRYLSFVTNWRCGEMVALSLSQEEHAFVRDSWRE